MTQHLSLEAWSFISTRLDETLNNQLLTRITAQVSRATGHSVADLRGQDRNQDLVQSRWLVMREAEMAGVGVKEIGRYLGGRDWSTVRHGIKRINEILEVRSIPTTTRPSRTTQQGETE